MSAIDVRTLEKLDSEVGGMLYDLSETLGLSEVPDGFLEYLMREVEPSPFIDGVEPPDFATFSVMLDGKPLSDHQMEVFSKAGVLTAYGVVSRHRLVKQIFLAWGKGSLSYSQQLTDVITGERRCVGDWCQLGTPLTIRTLSTSGEIVLAETSPVFCKGSIQTYLVTLEDGRSVGVSPDHKFLAMIPGETQATWVKCQDLVVGGTSVLTSPLEHGVLYARQCQQPLNFQVGCPDGSHSCGAPAHSGGVPYQGTAPSHSGAPSPESCGDYPYSLEDSAWSGIAPEHSVPWGQCLRDAKILDDAYQPLSRSSCDDAEFPLECHISPQVQRVLDHVCSLPPQEKSALLGEFAYLSTAHSEAQEIPQQVLSTSMLWGQIAHSLQRSPVEFSPPIHTSDESPEQSYIYGLPVPPLSSLTPCVVVSITPHEHTTIYDLTVPLTHCYFDDDGILHHNSGKDWISARFCAWVSYILLNMVNPHQYLRPRQKTVEDERINILNIAPKGQLAKEVFFEELSRNFTRDIFKPWMIKPKDQILTDRITFPQINLRIISLNSSASGLDGYNPLIWIMDEADAFLDNANKSNADGLRKILVSSATTRWPGRWMGLILSYLRSGSGFMARLITMYRMTPSPLILIDQAASWTVNPNIREDDPEIKQAFFEDPVAAAAMYRGDVPPVVDPFFGRHEYIRQSLGEHSSPAIIRVHRDLDQLIWREMNGKQMPYVWPELEYLQKEPGRKYYLGVDAGESGDSYTISVVSVADDAELGPGVLCPKCWGSAEAFYKSSIDQYTPVPPTMPRDNLLCQACGSQPTDFVYHTANNAVAVRGWHLRGSTSSKRKLLTVGHEEVEMPHIREDILVGLDPIKKRSLKEMPDGAPVDYLSTQSLLEKLCRGLGVVDAGFDPYQMVSAMQYLSSNTSTNIHKMLFSNKEQFVRLRLLRFLMYSGLTEFAGANAAEAHTAEKACVEMEQLQKIGQRLDHPVGGSSDLVDARAIAFYLAIKDNVGESHLEWLFEEKSLKSASGQE